MLDNPMIDMATELESLHVIFELGGVLRAGGGRRFSKEPRQFAYLNGQLGKRPELGKGI